MTFFYKFRLNISIIVISPRLLADNQGLRCDSQITTLRIMILLGELNIDLLKEIVIVVLIFILS